MKKFIFLPALALVVSCGGNDEVASGSFDDGEEGETTYSINSNEDNGETVIKSGDREVRIGTGAKAVDSLPLGLKIYPGAEIKSSVTGTGEGKSGAMIVLHSDDSSEEVIAFYKDQMKAKGIKTNAEVNTEDMRMLNGVNESGEGVNVTVTKDDDGGVNVMLMAGG